MKLSQPDPPESAPDGELARLYNDSAIAINLLYEGALGGSGRSRQALRAIHDKLMRMAIWHGTLRRIKRAE